jgi:hypothetical protein
MLVAATAWSSGVAANGVISSMTRASVGGEGTVGSDWTAAVALTVSASVLTARPPPASSPRAPDLRGTSTCRGTVDDRWWPGAAPARTVVRSGRALPLLAAPPSP